MRLRPLALGTLLLAILGGPQPLRAEEVIETAEDGTVLARYQTDEEGRRDGSYERFHPNGRKAVRATYRAGQRHGLERTWEAGGALRTAHSFRRGMLHGSHKTYDKNGHVQLQQAYKDGVLHGSYKSYHPNRRLYVVSGYKNGKLHGKYHERRPDGMTRLKTTYEAGRLHGTYEVFDGKVRITKQVWKHGEPLDVDGLMPFPRSEESLREALKNILKGTGPLPSGDLDADRELALRQLKAYRFLVGVPYADLTLEETCNAHAQAGAEVCAALGEITHTPRNPGWPADRFASAAIGAKNSNLHQGQRACTSVRGYMDDSDPSNIAKVGHRCWCMNPSMLKTGFGHKQGFTAMWATDKSRPKVPDLEVVSLPPRGYVPAAWIGARWAWSASFGPKHFDAPRAEQVKVLVEPVGADFLPIGSALKLDYARVKQESVGMPYVVIFRPVGISLDTGQRYRVTVEGLTRKSKPKPMRYYVEFFDLPYVFPKLPRSQDDR